MHLKIRINHRFCVLCVLLFKNGTVHTPRRQASRAAQGFPLLLCLPSQEIGNNFNSLTGPPSQGEVPHGRVTASKGLTSLPGLPPGSLRCQEGQLVVCFNRFSHRIANGRGGWPAGGWQGLGPGCGPLVPGVRVRNQGDGQHRAKSRVAGAEEPSAISSRLPRGAGLGWASGLFGCPQGTYLGPRYGAHQGLPLWEVGTRRTRGEDVPQSQPLREGRTHSIPPWPSEPCSPAHAQPASHLQLGSRAGQVGTGSCGWEVKSEGDPHPTVSPVPSQGWGAHCREGAVEKGPPGWRPT